MQSEKYRVKNTIDLKNTETRVVIKNAAKKLKKTGKKLAGIQEKLYAHGKYSVLICLQGMDTAGKDSLVREVFKYFNTTGIDVVGFKQPSTLEKKHDFLWRHIVRLPPRGSFMIFNRTHYENVLVTRVHPEYILGENIPSIRSVEDVTDDFFHRRMDYINHFEHFLIENGTIVFKFFLNLSKEEQKNRLLRRIRIGEKNWKFSVNDVKERQLWDNYMFCYQDMLNRTSTDHAPWHVIPADDKPSARYIVARILLEVMESFTDIQEPELDPEVKKQLANYKDLLEKE